MSICTLIETYDSCCEGSRSLGIRVVQAQGRPVLSRQWFPSVSPCQADYRWAMARDTCHMPACLRRFAVIPWFTHVQPPWLQGRSLCMYRIWEAVSCDCYFSSLLQREMWTCQMLRKQCSQQATICLYTAVCGYLHASCRMR